MALSVMYSESVCDLAVSWVLKDHVSVTEVSHRLGCHRSSVDGWVDCCVLLIDNAPIHTAV